MGITEYAKSKGWSRYFITVTKTIICHHKDKIVRVEMRWQDGFITGQCTCGKIFIYESGGHEYNY